MERKIVRKGTAQKRSDDGNRQSRRPYAKSQERPGRKKFEDKPFEEKPRTRRSSSNQFEEKPRARRFSAAQSEEKPRTRRFSSDRFEEKPRARRASNNQFEEKPRTRRFSNDRFEEKPRSRSFSRPAPRPKQSQPKEDDGLVRLNKFIANSGICSRREADTYIETGLVKVNGKIVTELGTKVDPTKDEIRFNDERLRGEKKVYIIMNKPKDFVTTLSDPHAEKAVVDLITKERCPERVYPVGRLDKATTGVLLFTNDGKLADSLTHPSNEVKKIYHAFLDKNLKKEDFDAILNGITLEDGPIAADTLSYVDGDKAQVGLEIHSGRNRIVRRIFEHLGYKVKKLDRVYFAGLTKKNIRRGEWRFLTEEEINLLRMGAVK